MKFIHSFGFFIVLNLLSLFLFAQPWPFTGLPTEEQIVLDEVNSLLAQGDYEAAENVFRFFDRTPHAVYVQQVTTFSENAKILAPPVQEALKLFYDGEFSKSHMLISDFLKEHPGNYIGLWVQAMNLSKLDPDKALEECNRVLYWFPFEPNFLSIRGTVYYEWGKIDKALNDFTVSIRLNPNANEAYLYRSSLYYAIGEMEKSENDCKAYIDGGGQDVLAYKNMALINVYKTAYKKALDYSDMFIRLSPQSPEGYRLKGYVYCDMGEHKKAVTECTKAIKINANYADAYIVRSWAYRELGKTTKSLSDANNAIALAGNSPVLLESAYRTRGILYLKMRQKENALADFEKALAFAATDAQRQILKTYMQKAQEH